MNKKTNRRSSWGKKRKMKNRMSRILFYGLFGLFILVLVVAYPVDNVYALTNTTIYDDEPQDWGSATCANFDYWMETFSIQAGDSKKVIIDKTFFQDEEVYPFNQTEIIYGLTLSGSIQLYGDTSLIRVILVDNDFNEYLVYEAYPLIVTSNSFSVMNVCEETCLLESITPYSLKIEVIDASIHIDELSYPDSIIRGIRDIAELQKQIKETQNAVKIKEINNQIKRKGLKWIAGETSVSMLFYEEKKKLFGRDKVPNLQGAEYYKGGILEIKSGDTSPSLSTDGGSSSLIESFDWRNRHGANNPDSPYYDGDPNGSGWITPVKSQGCNHCWAFTPLHATEAIVNLYFNQHLDLDLSEQDVASCSGGNIGCCEGGYKGTALDYITNTGVVDEGCFPYSASCESCANKCSNPNEQINISGKLYPGYDEEDIKRAIINYGPITGGILSWWHVMVMVGFDKDPEDRETLWIFKNSWGTGWGDNGYGYLKVELNDMYSREALLTPVTSLETPYEIACYDKDGDGYYNWGISENKPPSCPEGCPAEKDCDDSNPCLGPFDSDGYCIVICLCTAEYAVHQAGVSNPDRFLNPLRELRDYHLKDEYVDRYYDYTPELTRAMARNPALTFKAARLLAKYSPMVRCQVHGISGDRLITRRDVEEMVSFTDSLERSVLKNRDEIGAERSQEIIKFLDEFKEQVEASEGKTFSEALQGSIYCKCEQMPDLVITNITLDSNKVKYTIENQGEAATKGLIVNILRIGGVPVSKDLIIRSIQPSQSLEKNFRLYRQTEIDTSTIVVCADFKNSVMESDEENNCLVLYGKPGRKENN